MATGIFSAETEEEFLSFERNYTEHTRVETEPDTPDSYLNEESEDPEFSSAVKLGSDPDFEEQRMVNKFANESCGCKLGPKDTPCSSQLTKETILEHRENCLELDKVELDMAVLGQLQALGRSVNSEDNSQRQMYLEFLFHGKQICWKTFLFLHTLSLKRYQNLVTHYNSLGLVPREHGNKHMAPHNCLPFCEVQAIVSFIKNFAEVHALPLPGRMPNHKDKALLLPSDITKSEVYRQYKQAWALESPHK